MGRPHLKSAKGFALPTVALMILIVASISYLALMQANNSLSISYKATYLSMARVAAKSAIDVAQEEFADDRFYNGTGETDLTITNNYRVTYQAEVVSTSTDGGTKMIRGTGRVYLAGSPTTRYVFDVESKEIHFTPL